MDELQKQAIDDLIESPAAQRLAQIMDVISSVQRNLYTLATGEDGDQLNLLKIGTVFQIFLVDKLAAGRKARELEPREWGDLLGKISKYAILEEGQSHSEFVFLLYADYIDLSAKVVSKLISEDSCASINKLSAELRQKAAQLQHEEIKEAGYVDDCLWISLEAMVKLLSSTLSAAAGEERSRLVQAVSQLAFEYGRHTLYAREQSILSAYIENQRTLDKQLQQQYDAFCREAAEQSEQFRRLIRDAFSPDIHDSLLRSAALARAADAKEAELLTSLDQIDAFFTS